MKSEQHQGVVISRLDYSRMFGVTRIFRSFSMAVHPAKLILAVSMIAILFLFGLLMDGMLGGRVLEDEFQAYRQAPSVEAFSEARTDAWDNIGDRVLTDFARHSWGLTLTEDERQKVRDSAYPWPELRKHVASAFDRQREETRERFADAESEEQLKTRDERLAATDEAEQRMMKRIDEMEPAGVFATLVTEKMRLFRNLMQASVRFDLGMDQLRLTGPADETTVIGSLRVMLLQLPAWLWHAHRLFLIIFLVVLIGVWSFVGGVLSRMSVVEAAREERVPISDAMRFVCKRWPNYLAAPLLPLIFAGVMVGILVIGGLLFNVWALDIVGGLIFGLALLVGFIIALLLIGWVGAVNMLYPAISAEATDFFDAVGRCYSYVFGRPWRFIFYSLATLLYGAVTYLFVGVVVFLTLAATQWSVGILVVSEGRPTVPAVTSVNGEGETVVEKEAIPGTPLWDDILPAPQFGNLEYRPAFDNLTFTESITAMVIMVWVYLLIAIVGGYAVSFYISAFSHVYLLMRNRCDGTDYDEIYFDPHPAPKPTIDKIEPTSSDKSDESEAPESVKAGTSETGDSEQAVASKTDDEPETDAAEEQAGASDDGEHGDQEPADDDDAPEKKEN